MSLLNLKFKSFIVIGIVLCLGMIGYFSFIKKSKPESVKTEIVVSSSTSILPAFETKSPTVYKENLEQQAQLKTLEFKLGEVREKYKKLLQLRSAIEGHIQLRQALLKPANDRVAHLQGLQKEGAMNDQDIELAGSQVVSIETSIQKALRDKEKVSKLISDQEIEVSKAEAELNKLKSL